MVVDRRRVETGFENVERTEERETKNTLYIQRPDDRNISFSSLLLDRKVAYTSVLFVMQTYFI